MNVCLLFEPRAWEIQSARYAMETVASVMEYRWRSAVLGAELRSDEAVVFVGSPSLAPAAAVAIVQVEGWPAWDRADVAMAIFEDEPLLCAGGRFTVPDSPHELPLPWLRSIAWMLMREEERSDSRRDQWECYSGAYSRLHELGVLDQPLVNLHARQLSRRIQAWAQQTGRRLDHVPRWRDGSRFAVALTHDVDDVTLYSWTGAWRLMRQARGPTSYGFRGGMAAALRASVHLMSRRDPYWNFHRWVHEEERHGFHSSFYFCPPRPSLRHEYDPTYDIRDRLDFNGRRMSVAELMRELAGRGFEVGLHGSYMSHRSAEELARQKQQIESAVGRPNAGIRQHFLRFDIGSTWAAHEQARFRYDTTLGYNEAVGFRAGVAAPFHPWNVERGAPFDLLEVPLTVMDGALFRSLKLDEAHAGRRVREHLDRVEAIGGLAVLLWHPNAAAEDHFPGWWNCYRDALDHLAARGAWVTTAAEIAEWWRAREREQRAD